MERAGEPWGWLVKDGGDGFGYAEEKKLELRLGPPGEDWPAVKERRGGVHHPVEPGLSLGYYDASKSPCAGAKRGFFPVAESKTEVLKQHQQHGFLQAKAGMGKELSQETSMSGEQQKCCAPPPQLPPNASVTNNTAVPNIISTRIATAPVVGWPPIRSFRRNLAANSKLSVESQKGVLETAAKVDHGRKGLFVKINMDGIPIGRKVGLKAYDGYEKLALGVDELFRGLLAAQRDPLDSETKKNTEEKQAITGLLDASGEYTLVYEDDEGDRMLVGDVPWDMFVSTVKRLRVLKSSELSALSLGAVSRKRTAAEC